MQINQSIHSVPEVKTQKNYSTPLPNRQQVQQFVNKYTEVLHKIHQAIQWLNYEQQVQYFSQMNQITPDGHYFTKYPFIIMSPSNPHEIMVHLGPISNFKVQRQDKVQAQINFAEQGQQYQRMMHRYASAMQNERIQSQMSYQNESLFEIQKAQSHLPSMYYQFQASQNTNFQGSFQIIKKKKKTQEQKREEMATGKDQKETKNIPKNFSKAIINFVIKSHDVCKRFLETEEQYEDFIDYLKLKKRNMNNIRQMSELIIDRVDDEEKNKFNKIFRILGQYFLKKNSIEYIFHSRIQQINWHLKYKRHILRALKNPDKFNQIKHL